MKKLICVFAMLLLFLTACGQAAPSLTEESRREADTTALSSIASTPHITYVKTEWESDYVVLADGSRVGMQTLLEEERISEPFRICFYDNGYVYIDYLELTRNRGTWIGYEYSDEAALVINFPTDTFRLYNLVSASAEAIELRNELGETYHFVPVPYSG